MSGREARHRCDPDGWWHTWRATYAPLIVPLLTVALFGVLLTAVVLVHIRR